MNKICSEWTVAMPWGKVAMVSWGDKELPPVLLVHGYMDSAATFIPLLELLPDKYYYVGFDMPGHGKSDPYPGNMTYQIEMVAVIQKIVHHMKWDRFIYLGHSMAFIIGSYYNLVYPGRISKMVNIDPWAAISVHVFYNDQAFWYNFFIDVYYSKYNIFNASQDSREFTYDEAVKLLVRSRFLEENEAEIILTRCLVPTTGGKYRFTWQPKMKKIAGLPIPIKDLITVLTANPPPILNINASARSAESKKMSANTEKELESYGHINITANGGHDVHLTNPSGFVHKIIEFLEKENLSKL